jgi:hypothetical protein
VRIELLHVPGCANLGVARQVLQASLCQLGLDAPVVEREGSFPSPTILVDGQDVMGRPEADGASCRLDVPTRERIVDALKLALAGRT